MMTTTMTMTTLAMVKMIGQTTTTRTLMAMTTMVADDNYNNVDGNAATGKEDEDNEDGDR